MPSAEKMKWNPRGYNSNAGFVSEYGAEVVGLLDPQAGEAILDLGCGEGALAEKMAGLGCRITAIDSSPEMVAAARRRGLDAHVVAAEHMDYRERFDGVFSNAALHWIKHAEAVVANVHTALKPRGRFCGEMGGRGNVKRIVAAVYAELHETHGLDGDVHNPWYFPDEAEYGAMLESAGFTVSHIELFERMTPLPSDMAGWLGTFATPFLAGIPADGHGGFLAAVMERLRGDLCDKNGQWFADYMRLRFLAHKA